MAHTSFSIRSIGVIRTPFREAEGAPIQPVYARGIEGTVRLDDELEPALADIEGFERIWLIYWFDRAGPFRSVVVPYRDVRPQGLVAFLRPLRGARPAALAAVVPVAAATTWVLFGGWPLHFPWRDLVAVRIPAGEISAGGLSSLPWDRASPLAVRLMNGSGFVAGGTDLALRAPHDGRDLFVLAEWGDATADRAYWPWRVFSDGASTPGALAISASSPEALTFSAAPPSIARRSGMPIPCRPSGWCWRNEDAHPLHRRVALRWVVHRDHASAIMPVEHRDVFRWEDDHEQRLRPDRRLLASRHLRAPRLLRGAPRRRADG